MNFKKQVAGSCLYSLDVHSRRSHLQSIITSIKDLPVVKTPQGYTLGTSSDIALLTTTTYELPMIQSIFKSRVLTKYTPIVMYVLNKKHSLNYYDWWLKGNPLAKLLLGTNLKDLIVPLNTYKLPWMSNDLWIKDGERTNPKIITADNFETGMIKLCRRSVIGDVINDRYERCYNEHSLPKDIMKELIND